MSPLSAVLLVALLCAVDGVIRIRPTLHKKLSLPIKNGPRNRELLAPPAGAEEVEDESGGELQGRPCAGDFECWGAKPMVDVPQMFASKLLRGRGCRCVQAECAQGVRKGRSGAFVPCD